MYMYIIIKQRIYIYIIFVSFPFLRIIIHPFFFHPLFIFLSFFYLLYSSHPWQAYLDFTRFLKIHLSNLEWM